MKWNSPKPVGCAALALLFAAAAAPPVQAQQPAPLGTPRTCRVTAAPVNLPASLAESSGLARSRRDPELLWTHNDGPRPELFAVTPDGRVQAHVSIAAPAVDWEDIESAECEDGACLYIGDIGDNDGDRESIAIIRVHETGTGALGEPLVLHARYPDGAHDAEALFVLPGGHIFVVTKGRDRPVTLFRYPGPHQPGHTVTLERVRELGPEAKAREDRVTGASASPDGEWVAIRTYRAVHVYRAAELTGADGAAPHVVIDLAPLREAQGEGVAIGDDIAVWLTSEAKSESGRATLARVLCEGGD